MPEFAYTARSLTGEDVAGVLTAGSKREILAMLADKSLYPLHVESREPARRRWQGARKKRIKAQVVAMNLTQLADLLKNGVPLLSSLDILAQQATHSALRDILVDVRDQVAEGTPLDHAMAKYPQVFGELTVSMVRAGSEGAFLEDALKRTSDFLELQEELKGKMVSAMAYPAFLAVAGFCVTVFLIVFFVPKFAELFERLEQQGGGLPMATVLLLGLSDGLSRFGLFLIAGAVAAIGAVRRWAAAEKSRMLIDRWRLKIPVAGKIYLGFAVSRFCRVLGTLLKNGVPLLRALEISSDSAGNRVLAEAIRASAENISSGETLSRPLANCGLIPRPVMAMISVAEESNNLDEVLINVADGIDRNNGRQLDIMVRLAEPALLMVMGGIILFVLVALLLPVFEMSANMS